MNKWLMLSDNLFLFGPGGVIRTDSQDTYMHDGSKSEYKTVLYSVSGKVTVVKESVDDILKLLLELY